MPETMGSGVVVFDYDGDGDVAEGIAAEIESLQAMTMTAIQAYAKEVAGTAIAYSADAYPYFFIDTNCNPALGPKELDVAMSVILDLYGISFHEILKRLIMNTMRDASKKKGLALPKRMRLL
jgi:hypothetical protein